MSEVISVTVQVYGEQELNPGWIDSPFIQTLDKAHYRIIVISSKSLFSDNPDIPEGSY
jgi:hypothetical protein